MKTANKLFLFSAGVTMLRMSSAAPADCTIQQISNYSTQVIEISQGLGNCTALMKPTLNNTDATALTLKACENQKCISGIANAANLTAPVCMYQSKLLNESLMATGLQNSVAQLSKTCDSLTAIVKAGGIVCTATLINGSQIAYKDAISKYELCAKAVQAAGTDVTKVKTACDGECKTAKTALAGIVEPNCSHPTTGAYKPQFTSSINTTVTAIEGLCAATAGAASMAQVGWTCLIAMSLQIAFAIAFA